MRSFSKSLISTVSAFSAAAGTYRGVVRVTEGGVLRAKVPLAVTGRPFALPKTFGMETAYCLMHSWIKSYYPEAFRVRLREAQDLMLDCRLNPDDISRTTPPDIDDLLHARERGMNLFNVLNIVPPPKDPNTPIVYRASTNDLFSPSFYPSFRDRIAPYVAEMRRRGLGDILYFYGFDEQELLASVCFNLIHETCFTHVDIITV